MQQPLFEDLIEQVSSHACDISVSSQNITSARSAEVSFVPYTRSSQPVVVEVGNPEIDLHARGPVRAGRVDDHRHDPR